MRRSLFLLILIFLVFLGTSKSFAQDKATSSSITTNIEYALPYPGILPDNPLYFMKALRDRVVSFFISDVLKKAEFNLLMADVRLNAAQYLFAKGESKYSLAETTISKGENYFYNSLIKLNEAKQQGIFVNDLASKLIVASQKHQQVIKELENKSSGAIRERFVEDERRAKNFEIRATQVKPN